MRDALAWQLAVVIFYVRSPIPGGRSSQGGVKVPTAVRADEAEARECLP